MRPPPIETTVLLHHSSISSDHSTSKASPILAHNLKSYQGTRSRSVSTSSPPPSPLFALHSEKLYNSFPNNKSFKWNWKKFRSFVGPGWLMSLAYIDPGNLESDLQTGAYTGYSLVWVLFSAILVGLLLQDLSSRVGVVTGNDLAQCSKFHFSANKSLFIYFMMEIAIVGSDIQEVLGSAIAIKLLSNDRIPLVYGCLITGLDTFTFLFVHHCGARYLEAMIFALIFCMALCFCVNWAAVPVDTAALAHGWFVPTIKSYAVVQAVGMVGAVIMPHNLYLHSGLVQSRNVDKHDCSAVREANRYFLAEAALALALSFVINLAILSTFAEYFFNPICAVDKHACMPVSAFDDESRQYASCGDGFACGEIGLDTAGPALQSNLGDFGTTMWALGLLAAGQASTMTATLAGQLVMTGFLDWQVPVPVRVAVTRAIALGPAILVCYFTADNSALNNKINEWLNILQSVQLPFAMFPLFLVSSNADLMHRFRLRGWYKKLCWLLGMFIMAINTYLIIQFVFLGGGDEDMPAGSAFKAFMGLMVVLYFRSIWWIAGTKESANRTSSIHIDFT